jgi:hypothetical protein
VSYNDVRAVIAGGRVGSVQTEARIAGVMGETRESVFARRAVMRGKHSI